MKRTGCYEKKITEFEKQLQKLEDQRQILGYRQGGIEKILISPDELQDLIQVEERKNRMILKSRNWSPDA